MSTGAVSTGAGSTDVGERSSSTPKRSGRAASTSARIRERRVPDREANVAGTFVDRRRRRRDAAGAAFQSSDRRRGVTSVEAACRAAAFGVLRAIPHGIAGSRTASARGFTNFHEHRDGRDGAGGQNVGRDATGADGDEIFPGALTSVASKHSKRFTAGFEHSTGARVRVIHIRIDLKLIFKLGLMVFFLSKRACWLAPVIVAASCTFNRRARQPRSRSGSPVTKISVDRAMGTRTATEETRRERER